MKPDRWIITRRDILKSSTLLLAGSGIGWLTSCSRLVSGHPERSGRGVRFGMVTDIHHADLDVNGTRYYRDSLSKLAECVEFMNEQQVDFLIELGDFKDQGPTEMETLEYLREVEAVFQRFNGPTYHVLGNHDMDRLSKKQFLAGITNDGIEPGRSYYAFDKNGFRFIVLDANYTSNGHDYDHGNFDYRDTSIPNGQLEWLTSELAEGSAPVVVFVHQLLDGDDALCVKNSEAVREILQSSGRVRAVFQGHFHEGRIQTLAGIHYYTLKGLIEGRAPDSNAYAIVECMPDGSLTVTGYRRASHFNRITGVK